MNEVDKLSIDTLRISSLAAINIAKSGHPGIAISAAPMLHTLFTRHLKYDSRNPEWINRDRFILSPGHGSALLYSMLRLMGLLSTEDLKSFRKFKSKTPGHPELNPKFGIECSTGPLGQGIAMAIGMATAQENLHSKFNEIDHYTYVIASDGDLQEGISMESISWAGKQNLSKLIVLYDSNDVQLDGYVKDVAIDNWKLKLESMGWNYILVEKNSVEEIDRAICESKNSKKPSFIEIKTIIGEKTSFAGQNIVHGSPIFDDIKIFAKNIDWKGQDYFEIPEEVKNQYKNTIVKNGKYFDDFKYSKGLKDFLNIKNKCQIKLNLSKNESTRMYSKYAIDYLNKKLDNLIIGSADISSSTRVVGVNGNFSTKNRKGRNMLFGVREFSMAAIGNGIALHSNFHVVVSTFLVFADYLKPAIRLSALMNLPITFIFTHDSIFVGEDGPTHQPIEQISMLRSLPNFIVIRPGDENEVMGAWELAINSKKPLSIVLSRQNIESLKTTSNNIENGIYLIHKGKNNFNIVSTGSELSNAYKIGKKLDCNVYSAPILCNKNKLKLDWSRTISIEALSTFGWGKYAKYNIGIDSFGLSGSPKDISMFFGFDYDTLLKKIDKIIKKQSMI